MDQSIKQQLDAALNRLWGAIQPDVRKQLELEYATLQQCIDEAFGDEADAPPSEMEDTGAESEDEPPPAFPPP